MLQDVLIFISITVLFRSTIPSMAKKGVLLRQTSLLKNAIHISQQDSSQQHGKAA